MESNKCPTCSKPLAGRGKCKSYAHAAIGPCTVGNIIEDRRYGRSVVIAIEDGRNGTIGWSITERDLDGQDAGRIRTHCTAWNPKYQKVTAQ